jgi:3',5'-cyclic AMP phosphodiesterase CpdA
MGTITWLHLSDLPFRASQSYDQNIVLKALIQDIRARVHDDHLRPDFLVFSGDLAFAGLAEEYALAAQFLDGVLDATDLSRDRLFYVPGNHDVDRRKNATLTAGMIATLKTRELVNNFLDSPEEHAVVFQRFQHYQAFLRNYLRGCLPCDAEHYFYVKQFDVAGKRIAILGLNSAWLAAGDDRNQLVLGERQVRAALEACHEADVRLAVMHHPFDWLRDFDRQNVEPLLWQGCHFVLHGHLHQVGLLQARTPDSDAMIIAAGACYDSRDYPNSYNVVRLDLTTGHGTVYLRMYSDQQGGFWTKDVMNYRNISDGEFRFPLPATLRPPELLPGGEEDTPSANLVSTHVPQHLSTAAPLSTPRVAPVLHKDLEALGTRYCQSIIDQYATLTFKGLAPSGTPIALPLENVYVE